MRRGRQMNDLQLPSVADDEDKSCAFKNSIRNNYRHLRKWAKRTQTDAFRIYDRQLHHYPCSIDLYAGRFCVHLYLRRQDEEQKIAQLIEEVNRTLNELFHAPQELIYWRHRFRRSKLEQYEKNDGSKEFFVVKEHGLQFIVNLKDYLDTGLFLDHRPARHLVSQRSKGKSVLNLFCYTGAFTLHAAAGGARYSKSVDLSNTYTQWARHNLRLNGFSSSDHEVIRIDCLRYLEEAIRADERYDLIVIDPPTLSRSKKMEGIFDIQQDHPYLLLQAQKLLAPEGVIYFSTNLRSFSLDESLKEKLFLKEITRHTIPQDFHNAKIHRCWTLQSL